MATRTPLDDRLEARVLRHLAAIGPTTRSGLLRRFAWAERADAARVLDRLTEQGRVRFVPDPRPRLVEVTSCP